MTAYQVFYEESEGRWVLAAKKDAASAQTAIRKFMLEDNEPGEGGTFVAVPARSWKPKKVAVETALKFS